MVDENITRGYQRSGTHNRFADNVSLPSEAVCTEEQGGSNYDWSDE